ncbi:hypothetical protein GPALN_010934 [Globodera pallida]|nr:hypothetical protein GPALN_010934 [Globodera pallida]
MGKTFYIGRDERWRHKFNGTPRQREKDAKVEAKRTFKEEQEERATVADIGQFRPEGGEGGGGAKGSGSGWWRNRIPSDLVVEGRSFSPTGKKIFLFLPSGDIYGFSRWCSACSSFVN